MPLYEYQCAKDGVFELVRKFSDPPLTQCPTCGGPIEKLASAPAIQFKGSGWYVTDYARKSGGGEGGKSSPSESGEKSTSTESKDSGSAPAPSTPSTPASTDKKTDSKPDKK